MFKPKSILISALLAVISCSISIRAINSGLIDGVVYIVGTGKASIPTSLLSNLKENAYLIASSFKSYNIIVSVEGNSYSGFTSWSNEDRQVTIVKDDFTSPSKTVRLAHCRNMLLDTVRDASNLVISDNDMLVVMDFDEVNSQQFSHSTLSAALALSSSWDVLSFNRIYYYDIWSLRYDRFNINSWNFGMQSRVLRDIIEADLTSLLDPIDTHLLPVYSAYNGLAMYRLGHTEGCYYSGTNLESFAKNTVYNHTRLSISEDCEHVAFHKCLREKHSSRIVIYSGIIS